MTAINIDQQKRLDYVKRKPTLQPRGTQQGMVRKPTMLGGEEITKGNWQPIVQREPTMHYRYKGKKDESFNLL